jgi:hypothetical protein
MGIFSLWKNPTASAGFEPSNLGSGGQHASSRPPKPLSRITIQCGYEYSSCQNVVSTKEKMPFLIFSLKKHNMLKCCFTEDWSTFFVSCQAVYRWVTTNCYLMSDTYYYGKVCLQHHNLLNYRTDFFKTNIFIKLMFRHWWKSLTEMTSGKKLTALIKHGSREATVISRTSLGLRLRHDCRF